MWLKEEGFKDLVKNWWVSFNFNGAFNFVLDAKLRALKVVLKTWNKEVSGFIKARKGEALSQVVYWDEEEEGSTLNLEESKAIKEARETYKKWVLRKEISWRQKSSVVEGGGLQHQILP